MIIHCCSKLLPFSYSSFFPKFKHSTHFFYFFSPYPFKSSTLDGKNEVSKMFAVRTQIEFPGPSPSKKTFQNIVTSISTQFMMASRIHFHIKITIFLMPGSDAAGNKVYVLKF